MTTIINNVQVSGTPEEIKALIDLYSKEGEIGFPVCPKGCNKWKLKRDGSIICPENCPLKTVSVEYGKEIPEPKTYTFTGKKADEKIGVGVRSRKK